MPNRKFLTGAALIAVAFSLPVMAADGVDRFAEPNAPRLIAAADSNVYAIASGGIGDEDRSAMEAQARQYSMRMIFSESNGQYIVADHVSVTRRGAEVMSVNDVGPLVYAQMPPGQYALTVTYKGVTQTRNVNVGTKAGDVHMVWPVALD